MRHENIIPLGNVYLTRENVDLYFSTVVVERKVQPTTARRVVSALQKFADTQEYIDGTESFTVDSLAVTRALTTQAELWRQAQAHAVSDPHANLPTNVLAQKETITLMKAALNGLNWKDMTLSWTSCEQTFVRCDSVRKFCLSDIKTMDTHGPDLSGNSIDSLMISYILRKQLHKEKANTIRQVGAWRHRCVWKCSIGMLGFNLFVRLHADADLHFYQNQDGSADWWKRKLIVEWKDRKAAETAYKALYARAGVSWAKITHVRKQGMEYASAIGELEERILESMSKHNQKKISRYVTEIPRPVMSVMSGNDKAVATYFNSRSQLAFPYGIQLIEIATRLFPRRPEWIAQRQDETRGDNSEAAKNFLHMTLPYLAAVIFQDGIYWIHEFPNHEASRLLLQCMPSWYPQWAAWARQDCEFREANREESALNAMNAATQGAFNLTTRCIKDVSSQMWSFQDQVMNTFAELQQDWSTQAAAQPPQIATEAMARVPMPPIELRVPARAGQTQHHAGFQQRPRII